MKGKIIKLNCVLAASAASFILASCGNNTPKKPEETVAAAENTKTAFVEKDTKYAADNTTTVLIDDPVINKDDIVKVVKHGDHWHVFTSDGKEHITYTDPSRMKSGQTMEMVSVVSLEALRGMKVSSIKVHGDHWHVLTADGREFLTYEDPSALFPNVAIGKYTGEDHHASQGTGSINTNTDRVVRILKHGDHYHVYTSSGNEYVTYTDPRSMYPGAEYGTYVGDHDDHKHDKDGNEFISHKTKKPEASRPSTPSKPGNSGGIKFISVVSLDKLKGLDVEKILKHDDHYHVYTRDGKEYLTHDDPSGLFPHIKIGKFEGKHGDHDHHNHHDHHEHKDDNHGERPDPDKYLSITPFPNDPSDPKRVVKIAKHGNHWHLYHADDTESVVYKDPSLAYPGIKIEDYSEDYGKNVDESEMFSYDSVKAEKIVPLSYMKYGGMIYATGFDRGNDEFIVPHQNHFHNIKIKTIIGLAKDGDVFNGYTARQVVATLKYYLEHPEERPKKAGWGDSKDETEHGKIETAQTLKLKMEFLMAYYNMPSTKEEHMQRIGSSIYVYTPKKTLAIELSDLEIVDGVVKPIVELPKVPGEDKKPTQPEKPAAKPEAPSSSEKPDKNERPKMTPEEESARISKLSQKYGMTEDEFIDALFNIPDARMSNSTFDDNGIITVGNIKYDFRTGKKIG